MELEKEDKLPPKLGPIKIPFFSTQNKAAKSSSNSSISSLPEQNKPRRGRPRKNLPPSQLQEKLKDSFKPSILNSILNNRDQESSLKKLKAEEKDIKIFVFQCGHACSACNNSTSKHWLRQNGYLTAEPASVQSQNTQTDSSLYQKFVEFYNAAVNSAPKKSSSKTRHKNEVSPKIFKPDPAPMPTNMIPNSVSGGLPQMILFPPPPPPPPHQIMDLTSPGSSPTSPPAPFKRKSAEAKPSPIPTDQSLLCNQFPGSQQGIGGKVSNIPNTSNSVPTNLATMSAVRMALSSHLLKQEGRLGYLQPNRLFLAPQNFPLGLPLQSITPSSSVRQPGAPYFLSPSSDRTGRKSPSSSKLKKPWKILIYA